jgi:hypothetical protein
MPWYVTVMLVGVFVIVDLAVVGAVMSLAVESTFGKLSKAFPSREYRGKVTRREFQSISSGLVNLGFSVHLATDEEFLHLEPAAFLRWCRAKPTSIPWDAVELKQEQSSTRWVDLKAVGVDLKLPAWVLDDQPR